MSDTDDDMMPNNVFKLPPERRAIHVRRQNINNVNKHYISQNQISTSSFAMTNQYRDFNPRSSRRETSPMSLRSFPNSRMQFQQSYYRSAVSSQGSVYNETHRSPMSVRSIDSSASLSAADIAFAFKNLKCNRSEYQLIKKEYKMFIQNHARRRIQKRRNLKSFMRQFRRGPGGDSGDEGSDSSISSDDYRSTRSAIYKENIPLPRFRPLRSNIRQTMDQFRENDLYQDCTEDFKQKSFTNIINSQSKTHNITRSSYKKTQNLPNSKDVEQNLPNSKDVNEQQNSFVSTLKDRFAKGPSFTLLPSERFSKSVAKQTSNEIDCQEKSINNNHMTLANCESDSECDEIFSKNISRSHKTQSNLSLHQKRIFESDTTHPLRKRMKTIESPKKHTGSTTVGNNTETDFNFMKPQIPIKKLSTTTKDKALVPKCSQTLDQNVSVLNPLKNSTKIDNQIAKDVTFNKINNITQNNRQSVNDNDISESTLNSTDASMKNSFMKRKLFTQTLDVVDNKNLSSDNLGINSPRERVVRSCREKNKVRKLVTSQSCLTRDVIAEDNVLDLIHKIVPPHQMNITNKQGINKDNQEDEDKWDVTSVLSVCNIDDVSDTYTDEEILNGTKKSKQTSNNKCGQKLTNITNHNIQEKHLKGDEVGLQTKVVLDKLPVTSNGINKKIDHKEKKCPNKGSVSNCIKSFWDTDFESELEDVRDLPWKSRLQDNSIQKNLINSNNFIENKKGRLRNTKLTRNFQNNVINGSRRLDIISEKDTADIHQNYKEQNINETLSNNSITSNLIEVMVERQTRHSKSTKNNTNQSPKNSKPPQSTKKTNEKSNKFEKSKDQPKIPAQTKKAKNIESPQTILNTSRQSKRLKEKREAKDNSNNLIQTSIIITTSPQIKSNKLNTSRESQRLKQKRDVQTNVNTPIKKGNKRRKQVENKLSMK